MAIPKSETVGDTLSYIRRIAKGERDVLRWKEVEVMMADEMADGLAALSDEDCAMEQTRRRS